MQQATSNMNTQPNTQATDIGQITLIGAGGMLGRAWTNLLNQRGLRFRPLTRDQVDLTSATSVDGAIDSSTNIVINCAAYTNVDGAETARAKAFAVNAKGVRFLAERCAAVGATLVHYSTDYVFNGQADKPYPVDHAIQPINVYGESKAAGEAAIRERGCRHLIVRTSWLYAPWGQNFVLTMLRLTREKPTLQVVDDQLGRPTSAQHLATHTLGLIEAGSEGTYHLADGGECTWYAFTREIARLAGHDCDIQPCTSEQFPRPAKRPPYSVLDLSKSEQVLGPLPDWRANLKQVIDEVKADQK